MYVHKNYKNLGEFMYTITIDDINAYLTSRKPDSKPLETLREGGHRLLAETFRYKYPDVKIGGTDIGVFQYDTNQPWKDISLSHEVLELVKLLNELSREARVSHV